VHCEGQIYGQAAWDLSQALVAKHGHHTGWRTSERIFFTSLPDAGGYLPTAAEPVYNAYINADDDDGNLLNGTPNAQEIFDALDLHGMANAPVPTSPACWSSAVRPALQTMQRCSARRRNLPRVSLICLHASTCSLRLRFPFPFPHFSIWPMRAAERIRRIS